jgi:hypothetical protein
MTDKRILAIESTSPEEAQKIGELWRSYEFSPARLSCAGWITTAVEPKPHPKPSLPSLTTSFRTAEAFYLTFGRDAVAIYHPLRWYTFLTELAWQKAMVDACRAFGRLFVASDGIVTRDESPVIKAFFNGLTYKEALQQNERQEIAVGTLSDLYEMVDDEGTWDSHGYWRFLKES